MTSVTSDVTVHMANGKDGLKISELLDAVVANVGDDDVLVVGHRQAYGPLQLAAVRVDRRVESPGGQDEHLQTLLKC